MNSLMDYFRESDRIISSCSNRLKNNYKEKKINSKRLTDEINKKKETNIFDVHYIICLLFITNNS